MNAAANLLLRSDPENNYFERSRLVYFPTSKVSILSLSQAGQKS